MAPPPFILHADPVGFTLHLAGEDVTNQVDAAQLVVERDQPTRLLLHLRPGSTGLADGTAAVAHAAEDADVICRFLEQIDPQQLEADYLMSADVAHGPTGAMLTMLASYARGGT